MTKIVKTMHQHGPVVTKTEVSGTGLEPLPYVEIEYNKRKGVAKVKCHEEAECFATPEVVENAWNQVSEHIKQILKPAEN